MKIGIDISQIAYEGTGVGQYLEQLINHLVEIDSKNEYLFFFSSLRKNLKSLSSRPPRLGEAGRSGQILNLKYTNKNVKIKNFKIPPTILDFLWNKLHIIPIEWLIGDVDVFISSDWTQPPTKAKKITILYDLIVYKYPQETDQKIVSVQKRRLQWVKRECDAVFCISQSSKEDAMEILGIEKEKLHVILPGT